MSTSRRSDFPGTSKKISSCVRPGVCEVRARLLRPVSALMSEDLPTLERPAKATSAPAIGGSVSIEGAAQVNCQSPANSLRPRSISFASMSAFMRSVPAAYSVVPGWCEAPDPEPRDSGLDAAHRPGMTSTDCFAQSVRRQVFDSAFFQTKVLLRL